eukprot:2928652-Rhodomonas_salina.1
MLIPELNLDDLVGANTDGLGQDVATLLELAGSNSSEDKWIDDDLRDITHIRNLQNEGIRLQRPDFPPSEMVIVQGDEHRGKRMTLNTWIPSMQNLFDMGAAVEAETWDHAKTKQMSLLSMLSLVADEYVTEWVGSSSQYRTSAPCWAGQDCEGLDDAHLAELWARHTSFARASCSRPNPAAEHVAVEQRVKAAAEHKAEGNM